MKIGRKSLSLLLILVMLLSVFAPAAFAADEVEYVEGVTVFKDENSATGYSATFVYRSATATKVQLGGSKFQFASADGSIQNVTPQNWTKELYPVGGANRTFDMAKVGDDLWVVTLPLPSGAYPYFFYVTEGRRVQVTDPVNPPVIHSETGNACKFSMAYVPFDAEKQLIDRSIENPRTDGQTGTLEFRTYDDAGTTRSLAVYLPYGYDKDREEPYKVFYLSHGGGGMELEWMNEGCVPNILDNLIAEGKVEPFIVVTMNNTVYNWNYDKIMQNQFDNIIPFIEENYNALSDSSGRAYAGLSMGGVTTEMMYYHHAGDFDYFGPWSASDSSQDLSKFENLYSPIIMVGGGVWDFGYYESTDPGRHTIYDLKNVLDSAEIAYTDVAIPGSHDWAVWPQLFAYFSENILWKPAVVAGTVNTSCNEGDAAVDVTFKGDADVSSVRVQLDSELPIASITSEYNFEYNADNGKVIVYAEDGAALGDKLFTINYDLDADAWYANGKYQIGLEVIEVTDADANIIAVSGMGGRIILDNEYPAGDADLNGAVNNADLVAIARYLVDLVEFDSDALAAADYDGDGVVNNADLVKLARAIVAE